MCCTVRVLLVGLLLATFGRFAVGQAPSLVEVASGFSLPLYLTHAGDGSGRLFVVEKPGQIKIIKNGSVLPTPFLDIRNKVNSGASETGLLGLAFHPDFAVNGRFFVNYTRGNLESVVEEYKVSQADPDRADTAGRLLLIFDQPFSNHNGGAIVFGPDQFLYIATGDGGSAGDPMGNAQRLNTLLGKILRIGVDGDLPYEIPPDNPFVGVGGAFPEIWAYGLRNPWRISFDRLDERLFAADVGQNLFEEVDLIEAGGNYGWKTMEGFHCYSPPTGCDMSGLLLPIYEYSHDAGDRSITGGYMYRGPEPTSFRGQYIFGDFVSGRVWALKEGLPGEWQASQLFNLSRLISSFGEDEEGNLYLIDYGGTVLRFDFPHDLPPDLQLEILPEARFVLPSGEAGLEVRFVNDGPATVDPIRLMLDFPETVTLSEMVAPGWDCEQQGGLVCDSLVSIPENGTSKLRLFFNVALSASGTLEVVATMQSSSRVDPLRNQARLVLVVADPEEMPLVYSQLALGGGFEAVFQVVNDSLQEWSGEAELLEGEELPWSGDWSLAGQPMAGNSFPVAIPAGGTSRYVLGGDSVARPGYFRLRPAVESSTRQLAPAFFYNLSDGSGLIDSTGTPVGIPGSFFVIPVEKSGVVDTGVAIAPLNASAGMFTVRIILCDVDGNAIDETVFALQGHLAQFVSGLFEDLPDRFVGSVKIETGQDVVLTVLRLESTSSGFQLTSIPPRRGFRQK